MRFKYNIDNNTMDLIAELVPGFHRPWLIGLLSDEELLQMDKHKLYLVCAVEFSNDSPVYSSPLAVCAYSDTTAVQIYCDGTGKPGSVLGILNDHASTIKVEPLED